MRKTILILLVLGASAQADSQMPYTMQGIVESFGDACVTVYASCSRCGETSQGSGFVVHSWNGRSSVVTNAHVLEGMDEVEILLADGSVYAVDKWLTWEEYDLAILNVPETLSNVVVLFYDHVEIGEPVYSISSPLNEKRYAWGGVTGKGVEDCPRWRDVDFMIRHNMGVDCGSSGGPVFNENGAVVGVITCGCEEANYAIPLDYIKDYLWK